MKIAVLREIRADETRVALDPESCKKLVALGLDVAVEAGAGIAANFPDRPIRTPERCWMRTRPGSSAWLNSS